MAALTATRVGRRKPYGDRFIQAVVVTIANANAADEWISSASSGFKQIETVLGIVPLGTADIAEAPAVVLNAQGTGVAAGTNAGDLGLEGNAADYHITIVGRI